MKNSLILVFFICFSTFLYSQEKVVNIDPESIIIEEVANGKIENNIFTCNLFDWKIAIPEGFIVTESSKIDELEKKGYTFINNNNPEATKINPHPPHLIGFERNKYNYFSSSYEALKGDKKVTLEEHKNFSFQLLTNTYTKIKELKSEIKASNLYLGPRQFYKITIRLYNAKNDRLILTQEIYNSFINDHLFSASINYTNEITGMLLYYSLKKSFETK
nr:hypothetical protein [uncultured Flavobacterium sp.]